MENINEATHSFLFSSQNLQNHIFDLFKKIVTIRDDLLQQEQRLGFHVLKAHEVHQSGAINLIHYCTLRSYDLRDIQPNLMRLGLSSLALVEPNVLASLEAILKTLAHLGGFHYESHTSPYAPVFVGDGSRDLNFHVDGLFGNQARKRNTRIMVTMSSRGEFSSSIPNLITNGMDCLRINTAHDGVSEWQHVIELVQKTTKATNSSCKILMDLAGPKIRTGLLPDGPNVVKVGPQRNEFGQVLKPAIIGFYVNDHPQPGVSSPEIWLPLERHQAIDLSVGQYLKIRDASGRKRKIVITQLLQNGFIGESHKSIYFKSGLEMQLYARRNSHDEPVNLFRLGPVPAKTASLFIQVHDVIRVTKQDLPESLTTQICGRSLEANGSTLHVVGCTIPSIIQSVKLDETIWFDDGKIGGVVQKTHRDYFDVHVTQISPHGAKLGSFKGINLPDSEIDLPALTAEDSRLLEFIALNADIVGMSFIQSEKDVEDLILRLQEIKAYHLGIVLKIETRKAFENLPRILLQAMNWPKVGVMIARGDLAVEIGFERLAEAQEEIMWLCEAAHIPVIWATQVLETMAREGMPSRAEVTDAAISDRADCVMLNKGPHIIDTVSYLDRILNRVERNSLKKGYILRPLGISRNFLAH